MWKYFHGPNSIRELSNEKWALGCLGYMSGMKYNPVTWELFQKPMRIRVPIERTSIPVDGSDIRRKKTVARKSRSSQGFSTIQTGVGFWTTEACDHEALCLPDAKHSVLWKKLSFQDWGVDGYLLKFMLSFKKHKFWGLYLSPSRFGVCVFLVKSGSAQKKKTTPQKKLKGIVSGGFLFSKQMILNSEISWSRDFTNVACFRRLFLVFSYSIHHGFLIFLRIFFGTQLLLNYCKQLAVSQVSRWKNNLSSIPLCCDCR